MKFAVYEGVRTIRLEDRADLKAAPGEIIIKMKYCGICGTDVHAYLQEGVVEPGLVLGHENVGTIAEIGEGVEGWEVGERIAAGPPGPCGECYYCRHGHAAICPTGLPRTRGLGPGQDGGMAEFMRVRDPGTTLHRIPEAVPFEDAVLLDIMAVGLRGIRQSRFQIGDNVVVTGAGAIGLSTIQLLKLGGARHITALEPSKKKRELALKFGADEVLDPLEEGDALEDRIRDFYSGIGPDIVFECAGVPRSLQAALSIVRGAGQVLVLGVSGDETPVIEAMLIYRETEIKASLAFGEDEIQMCLDFLARRKFSTKGMVSDIIPLDDIVEKGFERLAFNRDLVKILVAP